MFEFTRNFYVSNEGGSGNADEGTFTPGQIIIPEQTVETLSSVEGADPSAMLSSDYKIAPDKLLINFGGTDYEVKVLKDGDFYNYNCYLGESDGRLFRITLFPPQGWSIVTPNQGTYTISAKIPEEKSPKVLSFPKGRTIVSELSRLNKAFGTISKKKTIIGQLSDLADAAEAGKIGGGSGALIVDGAINPEDGSVTLDKTWQEIYDAMTDNTLVWMKVVPTRPNASSVSYSQVLSAQSYKTPDETGGGEMKYTVGIIRANGSELTIEAFICDSADGYPRLESEA